MMAHRYPVPTQQHRCEIEVKRSRFIATVAATPSMEEARAFIRAMQQEFPDANHNCWACVIGAPGTSCETAMSDDGEPHGSAGKPMLSALEHSGIGDVTIVVSRYFGGIRLGKGGMARAYTDAVLAVLSDLPLAPKIDYCSVQLSCEYAFLEPVQRLFDVYEVILDEQLFTDHVRLRLRLPHEHLTPFCVHVTDLGHGRITIMTAD